MSDHEQLEEFATLDHDREARQGFPEVIFGEGKTSEDLASIAKQLFERSGRLLATRASAEQYAKVLEVIAEAKYNARGRCIFIEPEPSKIAQSFRSATIALVCAGTSDIPVVEEAATTLAVAGVGHVLRIYDVGVAGIHRVLSREEELQTADVVIVVAGMEGALPSVVGGLVKCPVIAVPTSIGYGASFGGLAALLGMLNSCASGLTVVNIDNGFGAAMAAIRIIGSKKERSE